MREECAEYIIKLQGLDLGRASCFFPQKDEETSKLDYEMYKGVLNQILDLKDTITNSLLSTYLQQIVQSLEHRVNSKQTYTVKTGIFSKSEKAYNELSSWAKAISSIYNDLVNKQVEIVTSPQRPASQSRVGHADASHGVTSSAQMAADKSSTVTAQDVHQELSTLRREFNDTIKGLKEQNNSLTTESVNCETDLEQALRALNNLRQNLGDDNFRRMSCIGEMPIVAQSNAGRRLSMAVGPTVFVDPKKESDKALTIFPKKRIHVIKLIGTYLKKDVIDAGVKATFERVLQALLSKKHPLEDVIDSNANALADALRVDNESGNIQKLRKIIFGSTAVPDQNSKRVPECVDKLDQVKHGDYKSDMLRNSIVLVKSGHYVPKDFYLAELKSAYTSAMKSKQQRATSRMRESGSSLTSPYATPRCSDTSRRTESMGIVDLAGPDTFATVGGATSSQPGGW